MRYKTIADVAKDALAVQDARNLSGVAHAFSEAMSFMCKAGLNIDQRNRHPIAILFVDKMASLARIQGQQTFDIYNQAYSECKRLAGNEAINERNNRCF